MSRKLRLPEPERDDMVPLRFQPSDEVAMKYSFEEIDQLMEILRAEAAGMPVDHRRANQLAEKLAHHCPDIRKTMMRIRERMTS